MDANTLQLVINDLRAKKSSYSEHYFRAIRVSGETFDSGLALGQIAMLDLLISNYENRLSEVLIDTAN